MRLYETELETASQNSLIQSGSHVSNFSSMVYSNLYTIGKNQHNVFKIERTTRKFIVPSAQNLIIGRPHFITLPILNSMYASFPLVNVNNNIYARASMEPYSYMITTEIEKSSMTLLDVITGLGGLYSLIVAFYGLLYGSKAIVPWGYVQRINLNFVGCNVRKLVREKLDPIVVWVERHKDDPDENVKKTGLTENAVDVLSNKINEIERRQEALELFLQNYVVDMTFCDKRVFTRDTND
ncbi:4551_t:CDS:2 [Paraglomus occultum]|uniref:4551_t:CDS:1 n=1 Tax=Paraglomus occultum TaxID=144539 RepID=A0A9N9BXP4_9GLOM|nr:4551_t:CDS:2 [Paraglomus occultum]